MDEMLGMMLNNNVDCQEQLPDLEDRIAMLNADQLRIFNKIKDHLVHQQMHEHEECDCGELRPLVMFISGVGGTGKSFLIESIKMLINSLWSATPDELMCAITAPTGLAAFNVGGITMHRLFQLPIEHEGKTARYWPLAAVSKKVMRTSLRNLKAVIVDEVSMVSALNLLYIHYRLNDLYGDDDDDNRQWFGGQNMLFFGDILQLPPVNGSHVFEMIPNLILARNVGCGTAVNIWEKTVEYDELTINERQKNDPQYSNILNDVRCGYVTEEMICAFNERVFEMPITEKFDELKQLGQSPLCLFSTRKACDDFNNSMLACLDSEVHQIECIDEVDETASKRKWTKKADGQLKKLNNDCNMTAGLEAVLMMAEGARVMLRRNIDTKVGLVNGALGTVVAITGSYIRVKFDHINEPYDVERVKGKFILLKNYFIYRQQFPLILAFAITIHKCQGLSLTSAIVDLSDSIFCSGMAYVALSRVKTMDGLHLIKFDPIAIKASVASLKECNRLRSTFRKDLELYELPSTDLDFELNSASKRKLTGVASINEDQPAAKLAKSVEPGSSMGNKRKAETILINDDSKKPRTSLGNDDNSSNRRGRRNSRKIWFPVNLQWQHNVCRHLGLNFVSSNGASPGGPDVLLGHCTKTSRIGGDGNCLFRSFAKIITGSPREHLKVRELIVDHMLKISDKLVDSGYIHDCEYANATEYVNGTNMNLNRTWGTDVEIMTLAHMLKMCIYSYNDNGKQWARFDPRSIDWALIDNVSEMSMYLCYKNNNHFETALENGDPTRLGDDQLFDNMMTVPL